jgi:pimeloyl-ACP methyl ester carboxylesterase
MTRLKTWQIVLGLIVILLLVGLVAFIIWGSNPMPADPSALSALESDMIVSVESQPWLVFTPQSDIPTSGLIFYPGGRVQPEAYTPPARSIAEAGYQTVIAPMPLNLAIFGADTAEQIIEAYPEIDCWVIAGHSLGGAMAARFAYQNPQSIDGLVLWDSYPPESDDLSSHNLAVASIYASADQSEPQDKVIKGKPLLPPDTSWTLIEGGNHAGFGWYGPQPGDHARTISLASQQQQVIQATLDLLNTACP